MNLKLYKILILFFLVSCSTSWNRGPSSVETDQYQENNIEDFESALINLANFNRISSVENYKLYHHEEVQGFVLLPIQTLEQYYAEGVRDPNFDYKVEVSVPFLGKTGKYLTARVNDQQNLVCFKLDESLTKKMVKSLVSLKLYSIGPSEENR